jgi:penicillin-binding protein 2
MKKEYRVTINSDDWVTPEETLLDSVSDHSDLERPIHDVVFRVAVIIFGLLTFFIFIVTFKISVVDSAALSKIALQNRSVNFQIPPPRGPIMDKSGILLTKNVPSFDLLVMSKEVREDKDQYGQNISKIAQILGRDPEAFKIEISDQVNTNSVFFAQRDLDKKQLLAINYLAPKGFYVVTNTKRTYINGPKLSQILGYIGKVSKDDLAEDNYYLSTDSIGRTGLEDYFEKELRGEHGRIFLGENSSDNKVEATTGNGLVLNIDADMQIALYDALFNILKPTNLDKAAAIIQDPRSGEVLALVSFPSYDNNLFIDGLSSGEFSRLFENKSKPLFNRVISGTYNPGSTIKPFMGMAFLEDRVVTPDTTIRDCKSLTIVGPKGSLGYTFNNWRSETGLFNLRKAIANSCNIYFFIGAGGYGKSIGLGIDKISSFLKSALADTILGIDLPGEEKGLVPTAQWKELERGESWYQGDTYNTAIGQGDLSVTPLWLNSYISAIANGGSIYRPQIVNRVVDNKNNAIKIFKPEIIASLPFSGENINEVRKDMAETVISGTAKLLSDLPVEVGAKTGTAEVVKGKKINSLFVAFAPLDNAELSITVLVEGSASNEGYAIRTAHDFLKWYFDRDKAKDVLPSGSLEIPMSPQP